MFGRAQRRLLGVLRELEEATVRDIQRKLWKRGDDVAYSTISTVLDRLYRKGLVDRVSEEYMGKERHMYRYKDIQEDYIDSLLSALYTTLGKRGVVRLSEKLEKISDEDLERLKKRLER
ncbi:MAG: BlaI/MecI/CopY family transcriptional regulator [Thermoplasmata archaeon]